MMFFEDNMHRMIGFIGGLGLLIVIFGSISKGTLPSIRNIGIGLACIGLFITIELSNRRNYVPCPKCNSKIDYTKLWRHDLKCYHCGYEIGDVKLETLKKSCS